MCFLLPAVPGCEPSGLPFFHTESLQLLTSRFVSLFHLDPTYFFINKKKDRTGLGVVVVVVLSVSLFVFQFSKTRMCPNRRVEGGGRRNLHMRQASQVSATTSSPSPLPTFSAQTLTPYNI
jgi:hypothetical protein